MSDREKNDGEHARALLQMAQKDLQALAGMLDRTTFADEVFGFHAQQAIEKALKAWMAGRGLKYPLTHDIEALLELLKEAGYEVDPFWTLDRYTDFAVLFRYASLVESLPDRPVVVEEVRTLFEHVQMLISSEDSPDTFF